MSKAHLFEVLSAFVARTEAGTRTALAAFANERGSSALEPWNFVYLRSGDLSRALDPYFAFADALRRWGTSFAALGVSYRGATLTLDLVDRRGKYENGFMHGPGPAFFDEGQWKPARINFTANAIPGAVGSGLRAAETLFHERGHAAHFSNILSDAPCFSQVLLATIRAMTAATDTISRIFCWLLKRASAERRRSVRLSVPAIVLVSVPIAAMLAIK